MQAYIHVHTHSSSKESAHMTLRPAGPDVLSWCTSAQMSYRYDGVVSVLAQTLSKSGKRHLKIQAIGPLCGPWKHQVRVASHCPGLRTVPGATGSHSLRQPLGTLGSKGESRALGCGCKVGRQELTLCQLPRPGENRVPKGSGPPPPSSAKC